MVFPVVMYGCESWTMKKAEHQRIDAFELWCWRRLLRVPWAARTSNQSILKEINPGCSLTGLILKLKLQYFGHLMRIADSFEKTLRLGTIEGRKRMGRQRMRCLDAVTTSMEWVWVDSGSWWWTGRTGLLWFMGSQRVGHDWATELNWNEKIFQFVVIHTVRGFGVLNKVQVNVFLKLSYFFNDSSDVGSVISGFCALSQSSLNIWKFTVHILLKSSLENF